MRKEDASCTVRVGVVFHLPGTHARTALPTAGNEHAFQVFQLAVAADRQERVEAAALRALRTVEELPGPPRLRLLDRLTAYMDAVDTTTEATEVYRAMADPSNLAQSEDIPPSSDALLPPSSDALTFSTVSEATQQVGSVDRERIEGWLKAVK